MLDVYYWPTPNGKKIGIFLEELGKEEYKVHPINITKGDQFSEEFLAIAPNNRMPAIIDNDPEDGGEPISVFESGAILWYLAEKHKKFVPEDLRGKTETSEWLFWQMGGLGPMAGQAHHFRQYCDPPVEYGTERYTKECNRLYGVLDDRLETREWVAAEQYTIADMAIWPWVAPYERQGQDLNEFPNLKRWFETIENRPAVQKALEIGKDWGHGVQATTSKEGRSVLFNQDAKSIRERRKRAQAAS